MIGSPRRPPTEPQSTESELPLAALPGAGPVGLNNVTGRLWTSPAPFAPTPYWAAAGDAYVFGSGRSFEIGVDGVDGSLRRLVPWSRQNQRVTSEDIELYKEPCPETPSHPRS